MKTDSQILEGIGVSKQDGKKKLVHYAAPLLIIRLNSNTLLKYCSLEQPGGSREGWAGPGLQVAPQRE